MTRSGSPTGPTARCTACPTTSRRYSGSWRTRGWPAFALTMPLKRAVVPLLARIDGTAARIDVVNTVLFESDEQWRGAQHRRPRDRGFAAGAGVTLHRRTGVDHRCRRYSDVHDRRARAAGRRPGCRLSPSTRRGFAAGRAGPALGVQVEVSDWPRLPGRAAASLVISTAPAGATDELAVGLGRVMGTAPRCRLLALADPARGGLETRRRAGHRRSGAAGRAGRRAGPADDRPAAAGRVDARRRTGRTRVPPDLLAWRLRRVHTEETAWPLGWASTASAGSDATTTGPSWPAATTSSSSPTTTSLIPRPSRTC